MKTRRNFAFKTRVYEMDDIKMIEYFQYRHLGARGMRAYSKLPKSKPLDRDDFSLTAQGIKNSPQQSPLLPSVQTPSTGYKNNRNSLSKGMPKSSSIGPQVSKICSFINLRTNL